MARSSYFWMTPSYLLSLGPKSSCPYLLKDKLPSVQNYRFSWLRSKIRKSKINFHQNVNSVTTLMPKLGKFLDQSSFNYLTVCIGTWKQKVWCLMWAVLQNLPNWSQTKVRKSHTKSGGLNNPIRKYWKKLTGGGPVHPRRYRVNPSLQGYYYYFVTSKCMSIIVCDIDTVHLSSSWLNITIFRCCDSLFAILAP